MRNLDPELMAAMAMPVPRYTSYPTALQFSAAVGNDDYRQRLRELPQRARLSLYVHIPFCHELCWYCGCNTKATRRQAPVGRYLEAVLTEIAGVGAMVPDDHMVSHLHWGGGSPNVLRARDIRRLIGQLRTAFRIAGDAEFAVEIDPRRVEVDQVVALADAGVNRISIGVQDFEPAVQRAINRMQPFETTERVVEMFRSRGIGSINLDLVYGLPRQTLATLEQTMALALRLAPERVAAFGYAHLPSRLKHQRLIDPATLPGPGERFMMAEYIAEVLQSEGYVRVGMDHFARPHDELALRPLARNFQGYTTDSADALIGFGASGIGRVGDAYVQNAVAVADYAARVGAEGLAVVRGRTMTAEDRMRGFAIERLMCDLEFSADAIEARFGTMAVSLRTEARALVDADRHGWLERAGDGFRVTERGRPFLRTICAHFDAYLDARAAQHAQTSGRAAQHAPAV